MPAFDPTRKYAQAHEAFRQGKRQEALVHLAALLESFPRHADAWNLAGVIHNIGRDFESAILCFRQAIVVGNLPGAMVNLGFAHQKLGQYQAARDAYRQAVQHDGSLSIAWQKLGGLGELLGEPMQALDSYRRAAQLDPLDTKSIGDALFLRRYLADWQPGPEPTPQSLLSALEDAPRTDFPPMLLLALPEADAESQKRAACKFAQSQWGALLAQPPLVAHAADLAGRRLRVGYLSSDFGDHAVSYLALEVIAAHRSVEVFLYSHGARAGDLLRKEAVAASDHFVELGPLDDQAAAYRIARDGIDVLVDLNGYTRNGRIGINAARPAAVIASWIGYVGTLGEPRLSDFVIGDAIATPPEHAAWFSESLALMPNCFQPNGKLQALPAPASRHDAGLPLEAVVFCSFNQAYKLHPALWDDWCEILRGVDGSVLWLPPPRDRQAEANLRAEAGKRDVAPARIVFATQQPRAGHLARLPLADIALDTYPYNSGTNGSDALRCGVPLVTFPGDTFAGRMAASLLTAVGMPECIARDRKDYVALAMALGNDAVRRGEIRERLQVQRSVSALFQPQVFADDLERLYHAMHAQVRRGERGTLVLEASAAP